MSPYIVSIAECVCGKNKESQRLNYYYQLVLDAISSLLIHEPLLGYIGLRTIIFPRTLRLPRPIERSSFDPMEIID